MRAEQEGGCQRAQKKCFSRNQTSGHLEPASIALRKKYLLFNVPVYDILLWQPVGLIHLILLFSPIVWHREVRYSA